MFDTKSGPSKSWKLRTGLIALGLVIFTIGATYRVASRADSPSAFSSKAWEGRACYTRQHNWMGCYARRKNALGLNLWLLVRDPPSLEVRLESGNWLLSNGDVNLAGIWIDHIRLPTRGEVLEGGRVASLKVIVQPRSDFDPYRLLASGKELYVKLRGWHRFSLAGSNKAIPALKKCVSAGARTKLAGSKDFQAPQKSQATWYIVRLYMGSTKHIVRLRRKSRANNRDPRHASTQAREASLQRERLRLCLPRAPKIPKRKMDLGLIPSKYEKIDRPALRKILIHRGHDLKLIDEHLNAEDYYECLIEYNLITKQIIRECFELHLRDINFIDRP